MNRKNIEKIVLTDVDALEKAEESYGNSWRQRGGVGAFMMLARKWDRIDIQDLRRYLLLVEEYLQNT